MDVASRLARRLVDSGIDLDRPSLTSAGSRLLDEEGPLGEERDVTRAVDEVVGLGPLEELLRDPLVSDVMVNSGGEVWVERAGMMSRATIRMEGGRAVTAAVERIIAPLGLRLDRASPSVDARLADGSRLHAAIPPVSVDGPVLAVRRFTAAVPHLDALVDSGAITVEGKGVLISHIDRRANIVVSGSTGSGKTTLLNVLVGAIPQTQRVVTIEDPAELRLSGHMVRLQARPPNSDGAGEITMRNLVRQALRLRPDRLIVGEVRGAEAFDMVQAMSTGHHGSMTTVHAGSPDEALWRLGALAGAGDASGIGGVTDQLHTAVDVVIQMGRQGLRRVVMSIHGVDRDGLDKQYPCS